MEDSDAYLLIEFGHWPSIGLHSLHTPEEFLVRPQFFLLPQFYDSLSSLSQL